MKYKMKSIDFLKELLRLVEEINSRGTISHENEVEATGLCLLRWNIKIYNWGVGDDPCLVKYIKPYRTRFSEYDHYWFDNAQERIDALNKAIAVCDPEEIHPYFIQNNTHEN